MDLASGTFVTTGPTGSFVVDPARMTCTMASLTQSESTYSAVLPAVASGRVYFSFGAGFGAMPSFGAGGPVAGAGNPVMFDKFELDTTDNPNVNATCVDFYGVSFSISATDRNTGERRSVGFTTPRSTILSDFQAIPASPSGQASGNNAIFNATAITGAQGRILRILAPKSAGLTDWQGAGLPEQVAIAELSSHFWDDYVNTQCWRPNRTFSCYSKLMDGKVYYGKVSADGTSLNLYTDAQFTQPYAGAPSLPRPSNAQGVPSFTPVPNQPSLYHNPDSAQGPIDWGFLLGGNVKGAGQGAYWGTDPVAMAIMVSICRGVMHLDDGTTAWTDPARHYQGDGSGTGTATMPIYHYAKLLHQTSLGQRTYALSYDDVYSADPTIYFGGFPRIDIVFASF